jgi:hypothetical protein
MKNKHVIAISCIAAAVTVLGGLGIYLLMTPLVVLGGGKPGGIFSNLKHKLVGFFKATPH